MIRLRELTAEDVERVRQWRNESLFSLRTSFLLTAKMQENFYQSIICDQRSPHRYWAVDNGELVGMIGLTYIQWENGLAEISLITGRAAKGRGIGKAAVDLALSEAFDHLRLQTVVGECYLCNPARGFWEKIVARYGGNIATLPRRKWWEGKLWDSLYFTITAEGFADARSKETGIDA